MRHVVWDWNGTLLDDLGLVVDAVNEVLAAADLPAITADVYTATYTRPVRRFYEQLYGRPIDDAEWTMLDHVFHETYDAAVLDRPTLAQGATEVLTQLDDDGRSQSLLSMYRHAQLVPLLEQLDLHDRFVHVQGTVGPRGGHKEPYLRDHLSAVARHAGDDPGRVLLVGDALDDAAAAAALGASCVLVASGSHPRSELEAAGVPVVDDLRAVLDHL